ncbi:hypothetical protein [Spongiactinospora gelatinilytica]|uniref:hypothetical protein n=1 Tax=Spongiactinospora gelatinilytica TaxID=2666298 RepID=UPI0018F5310D|nr:hypothetical protein [Spongiactinospora gelatinilytica]
MCNTSCVVGGGYRVVTFEVAHVGTIGDYVTSNGPIYDASGWFAEMPKGTVVAYALCAS